MKTDAFTQAYLWALVWSSTDESEDYENATVSDSLLNKAIKDCKEFQKFHSNLYKGIDDTQAGLNFALSRNGHGAGFFDLNLNDAQIAAKAYGNVYVYVGDDGKLYCD